MNLRQVISIAMAAALCLTVAGCSGQTASHSSVPASAPTPAPSPSALDCTAASVLAQVGQMLAGQEFEAHYLTIGNKFTLSVWLVDPEIDPATPRPGVADRRSTRL